MGVVVKIKKYVLWRNEVLKRDNKLCQYNNCGVKTNIGNYYGGSPGMCGDCFSGNQKQRKEESNQLK